jgi:hypothetical protein
MCCQTYFTEAAFVEGEQCPIDKWYEDNPLFIELTGVQHEQ